MPEDRAAKRFPVSLPRARRETSGRADGGVRDCAEPSSVAANGGRMRKDPHPGPLPGGEGAMNRCAHFLNGDWFVPHVEIDRHALSQGRGGTPVIGPALASLKSARAVGSGRSYGGRPMPSSAPGSSRIVRSVMSWSS